MKWLPLDSCYPVDRTCPRNVQHHFGEGMATWVLLDLVGLEGDPFLGLVILDVLTTLVVIIAHPVGPPAGLLFDFQKRINVRGEHVTGTA